MVHTLLDDPSGPVEASATAGFGYAALAGLREGVSPPKTRRIASRAQEAILARTGEDGTPTSDTPDFYNAPPNVSAPYGQAPGILFLMELARN